MSNGCLTAVWLGNRMHELPRYPPLLSSSSFIPTPTRSCRPITEFQVPEDPQDKSSFSEIIASISDAKFSRDGQYIVARDYMTLKLWDVRHEARPVETFRIHDQLKSKLCDLYENDCIFDKFECTSGKDGTHFMTGSYHNTFHIHDKNSKESQMLEVAKETPKRIKSSKGSSKAAPKRKVRYGSGCGCSFRAVVVPSGPSGPSGPPLTAGRV